MEETYKVESNLPVPVERNFDFNVKEAFMLLRRNLYPISSVIFFVTVLTCIFLVVTPKLYTASAVLQINVRANKVINIESVSSSLSNDDSAIISELDILQSRYLAGKVIEKLKLENDVEFNPNLAPKKFWSDLVGYFGSSPAITLGDKTAEENAEDSKKAVNTEVIDNFLRHLSVMRKPRSYTITVNFSSHSPERARDVANAVAEEYINSQLASKFDATEQANQWLSGKLVELQKNVHESEMKVQSFREQNNLLENGNGQTITDQQLSEINTQLVTAHASRAEAEAKLANSHISIDSSPEVLNSGLIQQLRGQEAELLRKKADLSNRYGPKHPKMININAEITDLNNKIRAEISKITESLQNEVEVARSREEMLANSLEQAKRKTGDSSRASVQLLELTREMNANRAVYESFLTRFKQTSESKGVEQADARIISRAEIPASPSYPNPPLFLSIAFTVSIMLGIMLAFLIENLDHSFRQAQHLQEKSGYRVLAMLPELQDRDRTESTVYYEAIRSVIASIHFSSTGKPAKKIMITSSIPDEGKSFFCISLARVLAGSGKKTVLIDIDMKRASLTAGLVGDNLKHDLSDYLNGIASESDIVIKEDKSGLHFIPARHNMDNSQDLISSDKMRDFLESLASRYDYIIMDTAPIMPISDALIISRIVDTSLFVVRWGETPQGIVLSALQQLKAAEAPIRGIVLTRVDFSKHKFYGTADSGYYHGHYREYYRKTV